MYTINVLTPRGHRQKVKITLDTTLMQVLEEVCLKYGFNSQDYDLRHHNKVLDISSMFRYTNLPNNAQLEMTEAVKLRQESPVTLGLQFETGERLTGVFSPNESIWNVIINIKPEEIKSENLAVIYMRKEISGVENLKATTLKSLGLTNGSAMFRILHKSPDELHGQASDPSSPSARGSESSDSEEKTYKELLKKEILNEKFHSSSKEPQPLSGSEPVKKEEKHKDSSRGWGNIFESLLRDERSKKLQQASSSRKNAQTRSTPSTGSNAGSQLEEFKPRVSPPPKPKSDSASITSPQEESKAILVSLKDFQEKNPWGKQKEKTKDKSPYLFQLGERNAVAFNLNNIKPPQYKDEPDEFFELTIHDAKLLLKQAKQLCAELENAPLLTSAQREFEKDKKILSLLHQYKKTVLRIKFPDRTVLQGTFFSLETVAAVEKFVAEFLESPKPRFYLYTTPPKVILASDSRLIECGCVPSCVLYFGLPPDVSPPSQYLRSDVLEKLSTPSAADLHAYQSRKTERKIHDSDSSDSSDVDRRKWFREASTSDAGPSGSRECDAGSASQGASPHFRLPKWFKANKEEN